MNAGTTKRALTLFLMLALSCKSGLCADGAESIRGEITRTAKVYRVPAETLKTAVLAVEFDDSPKLTELMRTRLKARGYTIAEGGEASTIRIRFRGTVFFGPFATKPKPASMGELIEKNALAPSSKDESGSGEGTVGGAIIADRLAMPLGASFRSLVNITSLADWLSDVTGLRAAFNKALTGDPRGFCVHKDCNKFHQEVNIGVLAASGLGTWFVWASTLDDQVRLGELIDDVMERVLEPLPPVVTPSSAQTTNGS